MNGQTTTRRTFEQCKRDFEKALASGGDYSPELLNLAGAVAAACLNKCLDPQRKTAGEREKVSDNGLNPALLDLKRGMYHDTHLLENTAAAADKATRTTFNAEGDAVTVTADAAALAAFGELIGETLSDGIDLIQTAAAALLEQAADHAPLSFQEVSGYAFNLVVEDKGITDADAERALNAVSKAKSIDELAAALSPFGLSPVPAWLDTPYTVRRLSRKVYIKAEDSAAYKDVETTPIQEVYRAVRRAIQESRAVQTDPRNGYTYIEDLTADGLDTIYHRLQKWADLGGHDCHGHYTADPATVDSYEKTLAALALSDRQLTVINLRMRGYGKKAIGAYLGTDPNNVGRVLRQVQAKAEKIGFTPAMWAEMTAEN